MAAGGNLTQAAYLGNAAAAVEIARLGNVPVDLDTLRAWLTGRVELSGSPDREPDSFVPAAGPNDVLRAIQAARQEAGRRRRLRTEPMVPDPPRVDA